MLGLLSRLVVGGVWVVAGAVKLPVPAENVRAVRAYQLLPEAVVPTVGYALPILELLLGLCLVVGLLTRVSAVLSGLLLIAFIIGISAAWARGLEIARDVGLLLLSAFLVWRPRTRWSLDNRLFPQLMTD